MIVNTIFLTARRSQNFLYYMKCIKYFLPHSEENRAHPKSAAIQSQMSQNLHWTQAFEQEELYWYHRVCKRQRF